MRAFAGVIASLPFVLAPSSHAAGAPMQTIAIVLEDPTTDPSIAKMQLVADHDTVKRGRVTFTADNRSKAEVHEVVVARDDGRKALPYDRKRDEVVEKRIRKLGEIGDLPPGKSGTVTLNLTPGEYVLFCNQPGHYKQGMVAYLTVEK
jgi:uncharacterized cupredoxin-like copper-binding protein